VRLLLINPNTSPGITDKLHGVAKAATASGTVLVSATAPRGVPYIATRTDAVIGAVVALEMLASHEGTFDAAIIGAFGDPGLGGARELFSVPIVGLAEAGMLSACMLGRTFSVITFSNALVPWYEECIAWHGLEKRCSSVRSLNEGFSTIEDVQHEKEQRLIDLANRVSSEDGADVVVVGGAPLSGLAETIKDQVNVPMVDCVVASVKLAEALVALKTRAPRAGTYRTPAEKASIGLDPILARKLANAGFEQ
jgi:allantoin racemase